MRFYKTIKMLLEVDDDVVLEYIDWANNKDGKYNYKEFLDYLEDNFYMGEFEVDWELPDYDLEQDYFLDEINRVKAENKND